MARQRVRIREDLDLMVARDMVAPKVADLCAAVRAAAADRAPDGKTWISMRDERVRPSHVEADGQEIPENLRYEVRRADRGGMDFEHASHPGHADLSAANREGCRCHSQPLPRAVADSIHVAGPPAVFGPRVVGQVQTFYPRAADSEFGTDHDLPARFMGRALDEVAAALERSRARRT